MARAERHMTGRLKAIARHAVRGGPMETVETAAVSVEEGVEGNVRTSRLRKVSVMAAEAWEAACAELGADLPWTLRRANLLVEGLDLPREPGARLRVGGVVLEVTQETDPCAVMDAQHPGLKAALTPDWRGGVSCRVIEGGQVTVGDAVLRVSADTG
jgi:MOSC domain-containing protein YiiM